MNTYQKTTAHIEVTKVLTGRKWNKDESYDFVLTPVDGAPMPIVDGKEAISLTSTATEKKPAVFDEITFKAAGNYQYSVKEVTPKDVTPENPTKDGIKYDTSEHVVNIKVTADENQKLTAEVIYEDVAGLVVTNTYSATGEGEIKVQKVLEGREWKTDDKFTFTVTASDGTPMPTMVQMDIVKNDSDQTKSFGKIKFEKEGTYTYTVKETKGKIGGIIYDEKEYTVKIAVKDNGKGELIADGCELIQTVTVTNTYNDVRFNKYNADEEELEGASFALYEKGSDTAIVEWTTKNGTEEDISEYLEAGKSYVIKETEAPVGYYSAENIEFTVGKDGTITGLDLDKDENGAYMIIDAKIDIKVEKVDDKKSALKGAVLAVKDENGKIVDQWTTNGTAHEVKGLKENSTYTLTEITAPSGYEKAADITFSTGNVAKAQVLKMVDKKTVVPDTSDHNRAPGWTAGMITSMLVAIAAFLMKKKYSYR